MSRRDRADIEIATKRQYSKVEGDVTQVSQVTFDAIERGRERIRAERLACPSVAGRAGSSRTPLWATATATAMTSRSDDFGDDD
jgi:hypothetical protein